MKKIKNWAVVAASIALVTVACNKNDNSTSSSTPTQGNWIKRTVFKGNDRAGASTFTIGNVAYVYGGFDGITRYNDLYAFDGTTWTQKAAMTSGVKRNMAAAFAIGTNGYIVGGACDANLGYYGRLNDVWMYDASSNTWVQKGNLPDLDPTTTNSGSRYDATAFAIGGKGYLTCGYTGRAQNDMWEYNASTDMWTQKTDMPATDRRQGAIALVNGDSATIVGGMSNGSTVNEVFTYRPATDSWTQKRNITNTSTDTYDDNYSTVVRANGVGFVLGGKGYITTGTISSYNNTTWQYDFTTDLWVQYSNYERAERSHAVSFVINGKAYVGLGKNTTYYYGNFDEFIPTETLNTND